MLRVVLDINILIRYLLARDADSPIRRIVECALERHFHLLLPAETLVELLARATAKPFLRERISRRDTDALVGALRETALVVSSLDHFPTVSRDADDDYLLAQAIIGRADFIVTGDRDLLVLGHIEGIPIVTPRRFWEIAGSGLSAHH